MRTFTRRLLVGALCLAPASSLRAQTADLSGHWEGSIQAPGMEVAIEVDLARNSKGEVAGTFGQLAEHLTGLPLANVTVDGRAVSFQIKGGGPGERAFKGTLSADGKSMSGDFASRQMGTLPFNLNRTGDARIAASPSSAAIGKEFEGTWNGTIEVEGKKERLVLKMTNGPDGSATGTIQDLDGSNIEIPVAMTQQGARMTIEVAAVNAAFTAVLSGSELAGTWAQGGLALPLTFTRGAK